MREKERIVSIFLKKKREVHVVYSGLNITNATALCLTIENTELTTDAFTLWGRKTIIGSKTIRQSAMTKAKTQW